MTSKFNHNKFWDPTHRSTAITVGDFYGNARRAITDLAGRLNELLVFAATNSGKKNHPEPIRNGNGVSGADSISKDQNTAGLQSVNEIMFSSSRADIGSL